MKYAGKRIPIKIRHDFTLAIDSFRRSNNEFDSDLLDDRSITISYTDRYIERNVIEKISNIYE